MLGFARNLFQPYRPPQNKFADISFGAEDALARNTPPPEPVNTTARDPRLAMYGQALNEPDGPATSAYKNYLNDSPPAIDDPKYGKPGFWKKLGGALIGASTAFDEGSGKAASAVDDYYHRPYYRDLSSYNQKGDRLKAGAALEGDDTKSKLALLKDYLTQDRLQRSADLADQNIHSQIAKRDFDMENSGWTPTTDVNGYRVYTRMGANGPETQQTDLKTGESPDEKDTRARGLAKFTSGLTFGREKGMFDYTNPITSGQQDNRTQMGISAAAGRQRSSQDFTRQQDAANPNRQFSQEFLASQNVLIKNPSMKKQFDASGRPLTPAAKRKWDAELQLLQSSGGVPGIPQIDPRIAGMEP